MLIIRIAKKDLVPTGVLFVDFMSADSAAKMIAAIQRKENTLLGPYARVNYAAIERTPKWSNMDHAPTDTLRIWNLPARALEDTSMLRQAFGHNPGLIDVRIRE